MRSPPDLRSAQLLCAATVTWDVVLGTAAVWTALTTGSLALAGFGVDAAVDGALSAVLVWRFRVEAHHAGRAERVERAALRTAGVVLLVASVSIGIQALHALVARSGPEHSAFGLVQAAASMIALPFLALGKLRLARRLGSAALRADAVLTGAGAVLAAVALAALALDRALGWWWADSTGALLIAALLLLEGRRALTGEPA